jgi:hypothetical protein
MPQLLVEELSLVWVALSLVLKVDLGLIVTVQRTTLLERQEHECPWSKEFE